MYKIHVTRHDDHFALFRFFETEGKMVYVYTSTKVLPLFLASHMSTSTYL